MPSLAGRKQTVAPRRTAPRRLTAFFSCPVAAVARHPSGRAPGFPPRRLRHGGSSLVGVLVHDISNPFFTEAARGIEDRLRQALPHLDRIVVRITGASASADADGAGQGRP